MTTTIDVLGDAMRRLAREGVLPRSLAEVRLESRSTIESLGIDSLGLSVLLMEVEDRTGAMLPDDALERLRTIGDLLDLMEGRGRGDAGPDPFRAAVTQASR